MKEKKWVKILALICAVAIIIGQISLTANEGGILTASGSDVSELIKPHLNLVVLQDGNEISDNGAIDPEKGLMIRFALSIPVKGDEGTSFVKQNDFAEIRLPGFSHFRMDSVSEQAMTGSYYEKLGKVLKVGTVNLRKEGDNFIIPIKFEGDSEIFDGTMKQVTGYFTAEFTPVFSLTELEDSSTKVEILGKTYTLAPQVSKRFAMTKEAAHHIGENEITWTIKVRGEEFLGGKWKGDLDLQGYVLEEELTTAGEYVPGSFTVNHQQIDDSQLTKTESALFYPFPANATGEQTITLKTIYGSAGNKEIWYINQFTKTNRAKLTQGGMEKATAEFTLQLDSKSWFRKSHAISESPENFDWVIYLNPNGYSLHNAYIIDNLDTSTMEFVRARWQEPADERWKEKKTWTFEEYHNNGSKNHMESQVQWKWKDISGVDAINAEPENGKYVAGNISSPRRLVITVKPKLQGERDYFKNSAKTGWDGLVGTIPASSEKIFGISSLNKYADRSKEDTTYRAQMTWVIQIPKDRLDAIKSKANGAMNLRIYDLMYFDRPKSGSIVWTNVMGIPSGIDFKRIEPVYFEYQKYVPDSFATDSGSTLTVHPLKIGENHVGDLLEIVVPENVDTSKDLKFTVQSELMDAAGLQSERVSWDNTAVLFQNGQYVDKRNGSHPYFSKMLAKEAVKPFPVSEAVTADKVNQVEADRQKSFNYEDNSVLYKISLNGSGHKSLKQALGKITVTDILPAGWQFVPLSGDQKYLLFKGKATGKEEVLAVGDAVSAIPGMDFKVESTNSGENLLEKAVFTFENLDDSYVLILKAKPTEEKMRAYFVSGREESVKNTVQFTSEKRNTIISKVQETSFDISVLDKKSVSHQGGALQWTIDYNPRQISIATDQVTMEDILSPGMNVRAKGSDLILNDINFSLYQMEVQTDGTLGNGSKVELVKGKNIFYDADNRTLKLRLPDKTKPYRFTYMTDIEAGIGVQLSNSVRLVGSNINVEQVVEKYQIQKTDAGASYKKNSWIEIKKVDQESIPLAGVEFTLTSELRAVEVKTTVDSGIVRFSNLERGKYRLRETKALDGYEKNDEEYTVSVIGKDDVNVTVLIADKETNSLIVVNRKKSNPVQPESNPIPYNPTPTPTPEPTPMPEPAPTPEPTPTPEPAPTPEPTPTPEPAPTPEPSPTPEPAPTPEPSPEPEPFTIDRIPDPRSPESPEIIVVVDEEGNPLGRYTKKINDDGEAEYLDEDGIPLGNTRVPKTSDDFKEGFYLGMFAISLGLAYLLKRKR